MNTNSQTTMSIELTARLDRLAEETRGTIELRYTTRPSRKDLGSHVEVRADQGKWGIWTVQGNMMRLVEGTLYNDPVTAITAAEVRWARRSPESPF